jgi:hypothetical protein
MLSVLAFGPFQSHKAKKTSKAAFFGSRKIFMAFKGLKLEI